MHRLASNAALLLALLTPDFAVRAADRTAPFDSDGWDTTSTQRIDRAIAESEGEGEPQIVPVQSLTTPPTTPGDLSNAFQPWSFDEYTPFIQRFGLTHDAGEGIGFNKGFTTLEWMTPITGDFEWALLFADGRVLVRNDATVGANFGVAYRWYDLGWNRIVGGNVFYDYRHSSEENHFHQLGLGLEWLGEIVDVRANAYIPDVDNVRGTVPNQFRGHRLIVNRDEVAMTGGDVEIGFRLPPIEAIQTELFAGVYHFDGHGNEDATGWRTRAQAEFGERVTLDFSVQDDNLFGLTATVGVSFRYLHRFLPPYTQASRSMDPKFFRRPQDIEAGSIAYRLGEPIERLQNIVLTQQPEIATDVAGVPLNFLHVIEGAAGDGTFETPYGTLSAAMADADADTSITYTPFGGAYVEDVTMVAGATILSNGPEQFVATQFGPAHLPFSGASTDLSMLPTLDGNVTLADNTRFSGFDVTGGISGTGLMDVTVDNSVVSNSLGDAISLMTVDGAVLSDLSLASTGGRGVLLDDASATLTDVAVTLAADDGVEITSAGVDRTVDITNLTVGSAFTEGVDINLDGGGDLAVTLDGTNMVTAADEAIDAALGAASTGDLMLSMTGLSLASTAGAGVNIDGTAGAGTAFVTELEDVNVTQAALGGFLVDTATFDADPTTAAIDSVSASTITIGNATSTTDIMGDGLRLLDPTGALDIGILSIANDTGTGLLVDTKGGGTTFSLSTGSGSSITTTNGPAMSLDPLDVDLAFDLVQSDASPTEGIFLDTVTGNITINSSAINSAVGTAILIQNTPAPLDIHFVDASILSTVNDNFASNVDTTVGNGINLTIDFDSLSITGP